MHHHAWLIYCIFSRDEVSGCWPGWSWTPDVKASASQSAEITGVSHQIRPIVHLLKRSFQHSWLLIYECALCVSLRTGLASYWFPHSLMNKTKYLMCVHFIFVGKSWFYSFRNNYPVTGNLWAEADRPPLIPAVERISYSRPQRSLSDF